MKIILLILAAILIIGNFSCKRDNPIDNDAQPVPEEYQKIDIRLIKKSSIEYAKGIQ